MNVENIWKPGGAFKGAIVNLEDGLADVLKEALSQDEASQQEPDGNIFAGIQKTVVEFSADPAPTDRATSPDQPGAAIERITPHTQERLAALASFDEARATSQKNLGVIGEALAGVIAAHHLSREFLDASYADIHRANEMEVENAIFASEARRLTDRVEKLDKQRVRYQALVEMQKHRETKLTQDMEAQGEELNAAKLEAVETKNLLARTEAQQAELHTALAGKSSMAERLQRENDMLRERSTGLALELEASAKKQAEIRRKYDDLSTIHANASSDHAEMAAKLAAAEKEVARMQKLHDALEARLAETSDALRALETELNEREKRYQSEVHALIHDNQALIAKLQASTTEHLEAMSELAVLKTRLGDLEAERHVAAKQFAALSIEARGGDGQAGAGSESRLVEELKREVEALRRENTAFGDKMQRLATLEKLVETSKQRAREKSLPVGLAGLNGTANLLHAAPERQTRQSPSF